MCQYQSRRERTMLRLSLLLILLSHSIRTAHLTDTTLTKRFDKLYQKIEKLNAANRQPDISPQEKLLEKLDKLNSLADNFSDLSEEDEEVLATLQMIGRLSSEQIDGVAKDLQQMKLERRFESEQDYNEGWDDEETDDYPMDGSYDWVDPPDVSSSEASSTSSPRFISIRPSAITKTEPVKQAVSPIVSAIASIAATNARPQILDDPISREENRALRMAALNSVKVLLRSGKCLLPQARWLTIKQLAPAADTTYLPSCVQLHRCAPDSGCCINEGEVCAPVAGQNVTFPIFLHKADGNMNVVKMRFYNHTECACVSRMVLQSSVQINQAHVGKPSLNNDQEDRPLPAKDEESSRKFLSSKVSPREAVQPRREEASEGQNDWRPPMPNEEPMLPKVIEVTAPPQLRRCTCPALFIAKISANPDEACTCVCEWPDAGRRRECQVLARGREHFGLRDRVCVATGDCTPPTCDYGSYDKTYGTCPTRRIRRIRYHRGRYPGKMIVV